MARSGVTVCKKSRRNRGLFVVQPQGHVIHEPGIVAARQPFRLGGDCAQHVGQVVDLGLGVVAQDMPGNPVLVPGVADTDPHPTKIGAEVLVDRAQAVVSGGKSKTVLKNYLDKGVSCEWEL